MDEREQPRASGRIQGRENRKQTGHGQGCFLVAERSERTAETCKKENSISTRIEGAGQKRHHSIEIKQVPGGLWTTTAWELAEWRGR